MITNEGMKYLVNEGKKTGVIDGKFICPICGSPKENHISSHCPECDWHLSWVLRHKENPRMRKMIAEILGLPTKKYRIIYME